jgi:hypothetical protein
MPNQFVGLGPILQGTTLGGPLINQLVTGGAKQETSNSCIIDLVPPIFSGILSLTRGSLGQLRVNYLAATDLSNPITYEIYIQEDSNFNLFNVANIALTTRKLNAEIFALGNGTLLQPGVNYYVGVRAVDAVGNRDANLVSISQTTPGILGVTSGQINGVFAVNEQNQLIASFWAMDNDGVINNLSRIGNASYVIYDETGSIVPSMSESGIVPDSNGFFKITPVNSVLDLYNTYYAVKVTIPIDGVSISYNLPITYPEAGPVYEPRGVFSINAANELQGSIWITKDNQKLLTNLGQASYLVRNKAGASIGISQLNIVADANGYFIITPVAASPIVDFNHYTVDITIMADGVTRKGVVGLVIGE